MSQQHTPLSFRAPSVFQPQVALSFYPPSNLIPVSNNLIHSGSGVLLMLSNVPCIRLFIEPWEIDPVQANTNGDALPHVPRLIFINGLKPKVG
jgi:hypothetical protein